MAKLSMTQTSPSVATRVPASTADLVLVRLTKSRESNFDRGSDGDFAGHGDFSAVRFDDGFGNGHPQAGAAGLVMFCHVIVFQAGIIIESHGE